MMPIPRPLLTPKIACAYSRLGFIRVDSLTNQERRCSAAWMAYFFCFVIHQACGESGHLNAKAHHASRCALKLAGLAATVATDVWATRILGSATNNHLREEVMQAAGAARAKRRSDCDGLLLQVSVRRGQDTGAIDGRRRAFWRARFRLKCAEDSDTAIGQGESGDCRREIPADSTC